MKKFRSLAKFLAVVALPLFLIAGYYFLWGDEFIADEPGKCSFRLPLPGDEDEQRKKWGYVSVFFYYKTGENFYPLSESKTGDFYVVDKDCQEIVENIFRNL